MKWIWLWPPYWGAGIRVHSYTLPLNNIVIKMPLKLRNKNLVGTHFGGNLFSMCDPWYMFILMNALGSDYVVWDYAAQIHFVKPGTGTVSAQFSISEEQIRQIEQEARHGEKIFPKFQTEVIDEAGQVIAKLDKTLYVRRKKSSSSLS